jgi:hypothetical protein
MICPFHVHATWTCKRVHEYGQRNAHSHANTNAHRHGHGAEVEVNIWNPYLSVEKVSIKIMPGGCPYHDGNFHDEFGWDIHMHVVT